MPCAIKGIPRFFKVHPEFSGHQSYPADTDLSNSVVTSASNVPAMVLTDLRSVLRPAVVAVGVGAGAGLAAEVLLVVPPTSRFGDEQAGLAGWFDSTTRRTDSGRLAAALRYHTSPTEAGQFLI